MAECRARRGLEDGDTQDRGQIIRDWTQRPIEKLPSGRYSNFNCQDCENDLSRPQYQPRLYDDPSSHSHVNTIVVPQ
jgi:hypothetical protein